MLNDFNKEIVDNNLATKEKNYYEKWKKEFDEVIKCEDMNRKFDSLVSHLKVI